MGNGGAAMDQFAPGRCTLSIAGTSAGAFTRSSFNPI
jgi:hypothetical protein